MHVWNSIACGSDGWSSHCRAASDAIMPAIAVTSVSIVLSKNYVRCPKTMTNRNLQKMLPISHPMLSKDEQHRRLPSTQHIEMLRIPPSLLWFCPRSLISRNVYILLQQQQQLLALTSKNQRKLDGNNNVITKLQREMSCRGRKFCQSMCPSFEYFMIILSIPDLELSHISQRREQYKRREKVTWAVFFL